MITSTISCISYVSLNPYRVISSVAPGGLVWAEKDIWHSWKRLRDRRKKVPTIKTKQVFSILIFCMTFACRLSRLKERWIKSCRWSGVRGVARSWDKGPWPFNHPVSQKWSRCSYTFCDVLTNLAHYFPKEGAFIWCCHLLKLQAFSYRWLELSTISFWISASVFWFFIRRSKKAEPYVYYPWIQEYQNCFDACWRQNLGLKVIWLSLTKKQCTIFKVTLD